MSQADLDLWRDAAMALPQDTYELTLPIAVIGGEAVDIAKAHAKYWNTVRDENTPSIVKVPGLELARGKGKHAKPISANSGEELLSLQRALNHADVLYTLSLNGSVRAPAAEARRVLSIIGSAVRWAVDNGIEDHLDVRVANIINRYGEPSTNDQYADALNAYAVLAEDAEIAAILAGFDFFDPKIIKRARELAAELRNAGGPADRNTDKSDAALDLRNRVAYIIEQKKGLLRGAANVLYSLDYPDIRKEFTSSYERKKRATARAAQKQKTQVEQKETVDDTTE